VSYAVTVSNTATATHAVLVAATVPLNTTVAHNELSFAAYCDGASNYVTCTAGQTLQFVAFNVPAGGSVTVIYPALVSSTAPPNGTLVNSDVWVQDGTAIDDYQVNVAAVAQSTATSGLHVMTSALPAQVRAGAALTYTLTFGNPGSAAVAANLTLPLPAGTTFVSASNGGTNSGGTVTWSLGTLPAGSAGRRSVVLQVASTAVAGTQLAGDAALRSPTTQAVIAHAALTTPVGAAPISMLNVQAVAAPDPVAAGQKVTYSLTVSNTATAAHAVLVTATVPLNTSVTHTDLTLAAYCDGASTYTTCAAGQTLQFVAFNVAASGSVTVKVPALVSSAAPPNGTLLNSDFWVQDSTAIDDYQVKVAAVAGLKTIIVAPVSQLPAPVGSAGVSASGARASPVGFTPATRTGTAAAAGSRAVGHGAATTADAPAAAAARYIIALDDVLASGEGETSVPQDRWPAFLAQRVRTEFAVPSDLMVVEPGVGIGRHALDLSRAMTRLEPGILARNGAKFVIVLDGIEASSIHGVREAVTVERIIAWHRQNIEQAHALGLKVIGGTVTAFEGARIPTHTESSEANREAVNEWTRNGKAYDGVVDFDLATRDPKHPTRLLPAYDSGDHLHPNEAGYKAMAEAIDLSLFDE